MDEYSVEKLSIYVKNFIAQDNDLLEVKNQLLTFVLPRIKRIITNAKFFIFEDEYVETAWKDMVSLHYVNTSYSIKKNVARVHFFLDNNISEDSYLGYITLRPINEFNIMLSFVIPNWNVLKFDYHHAYIMTYEQYIHIEGKQINIRTFPFFTQDGIVSICAHADILMCSMFLNKKYGYKKIKLYEMIDTQKTSIFPQTGLDPSEVINIFSENKVPIKVIPRSIDGIEEDSLSERLILTYIKSQIPIIIGIDKHVVLIVGYIIKDNQIEFIIYDDSGVFVQSKEDFVSIKSWAYFKEKIKEKKNDEFYIIIPEPERVYLQYMDYDAFLEEYIKYNVELKKVLGKNYIRKDLLIDNCEFKNYLISCIDKDLVNEQERQKIRKILKKSMPHYLWLTELHSQISDDKFILFADTTIHTYSTNSVFTDENLFICNNSKPNEEMNLLYKR